jgi:hypothetical protein
MVNVRAISARTICSVIRLSSIRPRMIRSRVRLRSIRPWMIGSMIYVSATGRMLIVAVVVARRRSCT